MNTDQQACSRKGAEAPRGSLRLDQHTPRLFASWRLGVRSLIPLTHTIRRGSSVADIFSAPPRLRVRPLHLRLSAFICGLFFLSLTACRSTGPYAPITEGARDTDKAQRLTQQAAKIIDTNPDKAEKLLREALTADLYHGPAHNNLAAIYLARGELFTAANEAEWAKKLMPGHPDPRVNLALILERAGRTDDALQHYTGALEVQPGFLPAIQGLARLQVRAKRTDERTAALLDEIALRGDTQQWRAWARLERLKLEESSPP